VLRPASRRASQRSASPYGDGSSPYEHGPHGPDGAPYGPGAENYGPDAARYDRDPSPYGPDPSRREPGPYQPGPSGYAPDQSWYGPATSSYGPDPYAPGAAPSRPTGPYDPAPYDPAPYDPQPYDSGTALPPGDGDDGERGPRPGHHRRTSGPKGPRGPKRPGRIRRLLRLRTVRVILVLITVFCCWAAFSVGQALTAPGGGSMSSKLAEWARDHYLGPVVTFGEWLSYQPPKVGGKPSTTIAVPKGAPVKYKKTKSFQPIIPQQLTPFASSPLQGEGVWRVLETVKGEPAVFGTFLRPDPVHTSYVAGIVSMDQRLVTFQLRPGAEDPGPGDWKAQDWIPPGTRTGLLATFNGGFKISTSGGGFYLNGQTSGTLTDGAASVVYYRDGTIKIGVWGRDVRMTPDVVGVRQNLRLIVDHGKVPDAVNQDVLGSWGATLGGGYYVWRSGLGITKGGRIIFVYGPALDVQDLADLLQRAGAVEALQLDINPFWMSYEYYKADGHPSDPTPVNLLISQQQSAFRYYSVYSRDFTAVYAR
jgi:Phosphodiester glycosidase